MKSQHWKRALKAGLLDYKLLHFPCKVVMRCKGLSRPSRAATGISWDTWLLKFSTSDPKGTLDFLLKTSILDRLCGALCDAVTGDPDGRETLETLEPRQFIHHTTRRRGGVVSLQPPVCRSAAASAKTYLARPGKRAAPPGWKLVVRGACWKKRCITP